LLSVKYIAKLYEQNIGVNTFKFLNFRSLLLMKNLVSPKH